MNGPIPVLTRRPTCPKPAGAPVGFHFSPTAGINHLPAVVYTLS